MSLQLLYLKHYSLPPCFLELSVSVLNSVYVIHIDTCVLHIHSVYIYMCVCMAYLTMESHFTSLVLIVSFFFFFFSFKATHNTLLEEHSGNSAM